MMLYIKKIYNLFCLLLCLCIILSFTSCKKNNTESMLSEEIVYEYIDQTVPDKNQDTSNNPVTESNVDSSNTSTVSKPTSTENKKIYKSTNELYDANLNVGTIVQLDIKPYAKGEYKIMSGSYIANDVSIINISSGKYAVRNNPTLNAWVKDVPKGSFIAHQGFNGHINTEDNTAPGTYPGNTKESVEHAVRLGYKMIEIDITITKDKVWVVDHDADTRATNQSSQDEIKNFTNMLSSVITKRNILRKWRTGGYWEFSNKIAKEKTPTLEAVFKYMQTNNAYLILDNKWLNHHTFTDEEYDILAELIKKYKMEKRCAVYAGCLEPISKRVNGVILAYSDLPNENEEIAYNTMSSYGNFMLSVGKVYLHKFAPFAKKYNVPLAVWVEDEYFEADKLFSNGADYILSNYCLPNNANLSDYKEIKSFNINDFSGNSTSGDFIATLPLSFKGLNLHTGDIIVLSAECTKNGGEAFIRVSANETLEAKRAINNKNTVYYVVNDSYYSDLEASFGIAGGSANFTNVKLSIMRETARGEKN